MEGRISKTLISDLEVSGGEYKGVNIGALIEAKSKARFVVAVGVWWSIEGWKSQVDR